MIRKIQKRIDNAAAALRARLTAKKGEGYIDSSVKILIAVVIGALLLAGLYTLFNSTILPTVTQKVVDLFNYNGTGS